MNILTQKISGVYEIRNNINGHRYIGSSIDVKKRWLEHKSSLQKNTHHSAYLQRAWNKYGEKQFTFSIIENCFFFVLIFREQYYIDNLKPEYNVAKYAAAPTRGINMSIETRKKMSEAGKGRVFSLEHRANLSKSSKGNKSWLGRTHTEETKKKLSVINKGKTKTDEHKRKLSIARTGVTPWNKGKKGVQVSPNKGKPMSDETKRKLSESQKERFRKTRCIEDENN